MYRIVTILIFASALVASIFLGYLNKKKVYTSNINYNKIIKIILYVPIISVIVFSSLTIVVFAFFITDSEVNNSWGNNIELKEKATTTQKNEKKEDDKPKKEIIKPEEEVKKIEKNLTYSNLEYNDVLTLAHSDNSYIKTNSNQYGITFEKDLLDEKITIFFDKKEKSYNILITSNNLESGYLSGGNKIYSNGFNDYNGHLSIDENGIIIEKDELSPELEQLLLSKANNVKEVMDYILRSIKSW